jgi:WD40 repeat protein
MQTHRPIWMWIAAVVGIDVLLAVGAFVVIECSDLVLHTMEGTSGVSSVAFNPDGSIIASGSDDGMVHLWDAATATLRHTLNPDIPINSPIEGDTSIAFSHNGSIIASRMWPEPAVRHPAAYAGSHLHLRPHRGIESGWDAACYSVP